VSTVLIELAGGEGVVLRGDGEIVLCGDVRDDRGQPLGGCEDFRPTMTWLDGGRSLVGGLLPPGALSAEVIDALGARVLASVGGGVYAAVLGLPADAREPVVCCRDRSGAPVPRPLSADWTRTEVTDAEEPCPACGAIAYDEVLPTDGSRGGRGGHGHDGPLEPCRIVVCRRCGHEEGAGSAIFRYVLPEDEDEAAKAARIARHRAEARVQKWHSDTMTLRGVSFPIYAAEGWPARIAGSGSSQDELTELTVGHHTANIDDPFTASKLTVTTSIRDGHRGALHQARRALEQWIHDDHGRPDPEELSDAATTLWFAAIRRERRAAALGATQTEQLITIDGTPEPFLRLSTPIDRWVAVRRHHDLTVTVAGHATDPTTITLEPIPAAARLLGPKPEAP
jgi:hypothetical protein